MSADELAAAVEAMGALPVPVGPEPQALRPIAYAAKNTDLLLADAAERSRAAEWPWDMWCRICHIRPTSHRTEAEALEAADRHVKLCHAPQAEVHRLMTAGGLAEFERLRARVAELEAERHSTNEALDDAVQALRADQGQSYPPALPWARLMDDEDLHDFLDELAASAITHASNARALAEVEDTIARWRVIGEAQHGHNTAPGPDAVTTSFAERAGRETDSGRRAAWRMLAQDMAEGEHFAAVHHDYRVSHDLPETGGDGRG